MPQATLYKGTGVYVHVDKLHCIMYMYIRACVHVHTHKGTTHVHVQS